MKKYFLPIASVLLVFQGYSQQNNTNLLIGTYTNTCDSKGIYVYDFDTQTADFSLKNSSDRTINPSYLTVSASNQYVYSVNENGAASSATAFGFNPENGQLDFINKQNTGGADPCYILDDNKNVITANYSGGNITVFGINSDGSLSESKQIIQHTGKGKDKKRQENSHVHMVQFTPDNKFVIANDLGTDKIYIYKYNPESPDNVLELKESVAVKEGSGPRHITFSPNGKFAYLLQELDGTLTVFSYQDGTLKIIQETQVVFKRFIGDTSAADIHITPDGKFLYATNRGTANTITCFKIFPDGHLAFVENISTLGKGPRNFAIDPTGNYLLVANQTTNNVAIFKINKTSGDLTDTGKSINLCSPVCLVFAP